MCKLTDGREDYDNTNWVKEESGPFEEWQYCKNKISHQYNALQIFNYI